MTATETSQLPPEERLSLIEQLWESLTPADVPLDSGYVEELDRRVEALDADLAAGRPAGVPVV